RRRDRGRCAPADPDAGAVRHRRHRRRTEPDRGGRRPGGRGRHARACTLARPGARRRGRRRMNPDWIGWAASAILLATLVRQIRKQVADEGAGVSRWLFIGQSLASVGFIVYSVMLDNWVFIVTNSCILLTAIVGQCLRPKPR